MILRLRERALDLRQPVLMGILNATPDSFSGDGIVVSILDTGIDDAHPAFAGVDLVQHDFTGEGNGDQHGHADQYGDADGYGDPAGPVVPSVMCRSLMIASMSTSLWCVRGQTSCLPKRSMTGERACLLSRLTIGERLCQP